MACLRTLRKYVSTAATIRIFKTFIYPHFNYCNTLLAAIPVDSRNLLEAAFFRSCRNVLRQYTEPHDILLTQLQLESPMTTRLTRIASIVDRVKNQIGKKLSGQEASTRGGYPTYLVQLFQPTSRASSRQKLQTVKYNYKTTGYTSFASVALRLWNYLSNATQINFTELAACSEFKSIRQKTDELYFII